MKNRISWMMIAILFFGIVEIGCYGQSNDSRLNKTWVFQNIDLKQMSDYELRQKLEIYIKQLPYPTDYDIREALRKLQQVSDSQIKQAVRQWFNVT